MILSLSKGLSTSARTVGFFLLNRNNPHQFVITSLIILGQIRRRLPFVVSIALLACLIASSVHAADGRSTRRKAIEAKSTGQPTDFRSQRFLLHTDLPAKEANELLGRLETMLTIISTYWGRPPAGMIELYVVKDLAAWPENVIEEEGRAKIAEGAGVTITQTLSVGGLGAPRRKVAAKAVVFAVADQGTPQHEAVHAYCGQTFGATGPVWYAEGMAEMGQYWRKNERGVVCHPEIIRYLQSGEVKRVSDILDPKQFTGDSWQNYAWRWALCHLLVNNTNYAERFRDFGLRLLNEEPVTFRDVFGAMSQEIEFELRFFVDHLEPGYRADLCSWDWKRKFKPIVSGSTLSFRIQAARGWQPTGIALRGGDRLRYRAKGTWRVTRSGKPVTAAGDKDGIGRLEAILMSGFELSQPVELSAQGTFTAPSQGNLYLRCRDSWAKLGDNSGGLMVSVALASAAEKPAPAETATPEQVSESRSSATAAPR